MGEQVMFCCANMFRPFFEICWCISAWQIALAQLCLSYLYVDYRNPKIKSVELGDQLIAAW